MAARLTGKLMEGAIPARSSTASRAIEARRSGRDGNPCSTSYWGCWRGFTATDVPDHSVIKGEGDPWEPPATLAQTFHRLIKAAILSGWPG